MMKGDNMDKLKDSDIRKALIPYLVNQLLNDPDSVIINEMGVLHGQSRVDVAVINGILHGYEIKSESDNLSRLPSQINDYNQVFDRMTIVVQKNYLEQVKEMVPKWWGIILVSTTKKEIKLREIRKGRLNSGVDMYALSHLLWKEEAIDILKKKGLQKGYLSKPRTVLYKKICESFNKNEIKSVVNQQLKQREGWRHQMIQQISDDLLLQ
ncbi:sce7726 family protein [Niallia circulans]|uniref:sce7726 family protein n=1 Tax=Niallia circulans TaxID=1397 RepID=UPI0035123D3D